MAHPWHHQSQEGILNTYTNDDDLNKAWDKVTDNLDRLTLAQLSSMLVRVAMELQDRFEYVKSLGEYGGGVAESIWEKHFKLLSPRQVEQAILLLVKKVFG